jgi:hypothetical protein
MVCGYWWSAVNGRALEEPCLQHGEGGDTSPQVGRCRAPDRVLAFSVNLDRIVQLRSASNHPDINRATCTFRIFRTSFFCVSLRLEGLGQRGELTLDVSEKQPVILGMQVLAQASGRVSYNCAVPKKHKEPRKQFTVGDQVKVKLHTGDVANSSTNLSD